jgi:hypothetical protein
MKLRRFLVGAITASALVPLIVATQGAAASGALTPAVSPSVPLCSRFLDSGRDGQRASAN